MQEELEVRLQEGSFPVQQWEIDSDNTANYWSTKDNVPFTAVNHSAGSEKAPLTYKEHPLVHTGQVKLELEVTLTPVEGMSECSSGDSTSVIPPTTVVCVSSASQGAPAVLPQEGASGTAGHSVVASSSSLPYLSVTSSTSLRALPLPAKPKTKSIAKDAATVNSR